LDHRSWTSFPSRPDALTLCDQLGLLLLVAEGGLHVNVAQLRCVGLRAFLVAITGTAVPVLLGFGFVMLLGYDAIESVVAGTALSSTSIGMATRMLQQESQLDTQLGNLIAAAAMLDDVLSVILLAELTNISDDEEDLSGGEYA